MGRIAIALLGAGTVGGGTYKLLAKRAEQIRRITGEEVEVTRILVHNKNKKREGIPKELLTDDYKEILQDASVQIVVELMGGIEPAKTYIEQALKAGKHVVTANKDLVAQHGGALLEIAKEHKVDFLFEAAVAGGIPIIRPLKQCLSGNDIDQIVGIMNGTTNFILTKMFEENMEFADALALAQELGYAEADPTADVEGYDAGRKTAILASLAFHSSVTFNDVYTEGISRISKKDILYAKEFDRVIKLLCVAKNTETGIEVGVYPMFLDKNHPLASVRDSFNAVFVHGDALDDAMFYGRGAGEFPTASAVVGDIIDVVRNISFGCTSRINCTCFKELPIKDIRDVKNKFFFRLKVDNTPGVLAKIASIFGDHKVSISKVVQKVIEDDCAELAIVTDYAKEYHMADALKQLEDLPCVRKIGNCIREF